MMNSNPAKNGVHLSFLVESLGLAVVNRGVDFDEAIVKGKDVNRSGMQLMGYFDQFDDTRLQVIGLVETKMLAQKSPEEREKGFAMLFEYNIPALVVTRDLDIYPECLAMARKYQRTLLHTSDKTVDFTLKIIEFMSQNMAPMVTRHGVLLDIYGEGVLITGESGIGKSETAIELIKRGHRLIADDAVEIRQIVGSRLVGAAPELIRYYMELRGIGVVDVRRLFGMSAVKNESFIDLLVNLEPWRDGSVYDRLGADETFTELLDVSIPTLTIPVKPGRNLAVIIEVAAMNHRNKEMGHNSALEFSREVDAMLESKLARGET